jgi:hypothetical protein
MTSLINLISELGQKRLVFSALIIGALIVVLYWVN